jgi:hypothetical protein
MTSPSTCDTAPLPDGGQIDAALQVCGASPDHLGRWEENLPVSWAGARLVERVRVSFCEHVAKMDLRKVLAPFIRPPYRPADPSLRDERVDGLYYEAAKEDSLCFEMPGRRITLNASEMALYVSGSDSELPDPDDRQQDMLLQVAQEVLGAHVAFVGTQRWTNSPFEEPPESTTQGQDALDLLSSLTRANARLYFDVEYFAEGESANPEIAVEFRCDPKTRVIEARSKWSGRARLIAPGEYRVCALACMYSMPWWKPALAKGPHGHPPKTPVWCSPSLFVTLVPNGVYRFAVGTKSEQRTLSLQEQLLFSAGPSSKQFHPRMNLYLNLLAT